MITYVSAFFDIGRKTEAHLQNMDNYYPWINSLLALDISLVFYTQPTILPKLSFIPRDNLKIITMDTHPYSIYYEETKKNWEQYKTNNPSKDTYQFACLSHSKFKFLQMAIESNYFNHEYYAWIDAGLAKIAHQFTSIPNLIVPNKKVKICMLNYIHPLEIKSKTFVQVCQYKIAAGFFLGSKEYMTSFCKAMQDEIKDGIFGLEQEYMAIVYINHEELFEPYFGDFVDLIQNFGKFRGTQWIVEKYLKTANDNKNSKEAEKVLAYLKL